VFRVVEVETVDVPQPDGRSDLADQLVHPLLVGEVVARGEEVTGVQTDAEIVVIVGRRGHHPVQVREAPADDRSLPGRVLQQEGHVVRHLDVRETLAEAELFRSFDFYWDPTEWRLRYVTPAVPTDRDDRADGGTSGTILQSERDDLGRTVAETIVEDDVDLGDGEPVDLVWSVETFGRIQPGEEE
jgi:hypothetical protein